MTGTITKHTINFGSGPAAFPAEVLQEAADAIINYNNSGLSILEIPHRGKLFDAILEESKQLVRNLCNINSDYEVLWLPGGGRLQFSMIPMNFLGDNETAGYIDSGHWSAEAMEYAQYYGEVQLLASSKEVNYNQLPVLPAQYPGDLAYLHYTTNNTIYGTQWNEIPACNAPIIADMSSDIFSKQTDYNKYAMFYACAQKNIGPAGVALAVIRKDLLNNSKRSLQPMLSYAAHAAKNSVLNTPPVFAIYTSMLMLRWTKAKSIEAIERDNEEKARLLYNELERNTVFDLIVTEQAHRSKMNVCFKAKDEATEKAFVTLCAENNITGIEGHRSVGGLRASLYNAVTIDDVKVLVDVMKEFERIENK
jgi:phosphoserine aminotransferase